VFALLGLMAAAVVTHTGLDGRAVDPSPSYGAAANAPPVEAGSRRPAALAYDPEATPTSPLPPVLRLALTRPASLRADQISLTDQNAVIAADLLYDGLTRSDPASGRLDPALALSWAPNADFTRWRFELDPARVPAPEAARYLEGLRAAPTSPAVASLLGGVERFSALGPTTLEAVTARPQAGLPWLLSSVALSVVGEEGASTGTFAVEADTDHELILVARGADRTAAGQAAADRSTAAGQSGPAQPGSAHPGRGLAGSGDSAVERVEVTWANDPGRAYDDLSDGTVDAAVVAPVALADAGARWGGPTTARAITRFYGLNGRSPRLSDDRVRQAVLLAVDRAQIARAAPAAAGSDAGQVLDGLVAPSLAGYRPGGCDDCRFDPAAAAALVGQVELESGARITLNVAYGGGDQQATAEAVAADLQRVGIQAELLEQSPDQLASAIGSSGADLFAFGWVAGAGSIDAVVPPLLRSGSPANGLGLASPEVDRLIDQASRTGDDQARWTLLNRAHVAALAQHQVLPLAVAASTLVANAQAAGLVVGADGSIDIRARD
jgi:ABC-type transport system substrate-binding protein